MTAADRQVLEYIAAGFTAGEIAARLALVPQSVAWRRRRLEARLQVKGELALVARGLANGLIDPARLRCLRRQRAFSQRRK